jgi:hypothetical protein
VISGFGKVRKKRKIEDYLQFASYYTREGKSTTSVKDGREDAGQRVVARFSEIGKDETDGYQSPRT